MSLPDDNTAKKLSIMPDTADVDKGWDAVARDLKKARGLDEFVYAPESIRPEVSSAAKAVLSETFVSAEDTFKPASAVLEDLLRDAQIPHPSSLHFSIVGGSSPEEHGESVSAEQGFAYLYSGPGENPDNHDAALVNYDKNQKKTTFVMAHGPQHDPSAASLANAVGIKAGYEVARGKHEPLYVLGGKINDNLEAVKDEFGLSHKVVDFAVAELTKPEFSPSYDLEVVSRGLIHCYVINPDTSDIQTYDVERVHVDREDLAQLFSRIETPEAMKDFVEQTETDDEVKKILYRINVGLKTNPDVFPRFREKVFVALVKQKLTQAAKQDLDEYVAERHQSGATPEDIIDVVLDFLNNPGRHVMKVDHGDVIVLATDELVQSMGRKKRTGYDIPFGNRILIGLQNGEELPQICEEILADFREKQQNEQIPDSSFTLIAYRAPLPTPTREEGEKLVEEHMGAGAEEMLKPYGLRDTIPSLEQEEDEAEEESLRMKDRKLK